MEEVEKNSTQAQPTQTIIIEQKAPKKNGIGTAGFVLALIALLTDWVPVLGWIVWALGALFSIIGLFKKPRGLAVAGFIISFIGLIILTVVIGALGIGAASMFS